MPSWVLTLSKIISRSRKHQASKRPKEASVAQPYPGVGSRGGPFTALSLIS